MINAEELISPNDKVLIKPNYVVPKEPSTGVTTDPRVVEGIVEFLREIGVQDITIGEGGNRHTDKAFELCGAVDLALRYGVRLVNLNYDEAVEVEAPSAKALRKVPIARTVLESTCIINVPKLKIHHMAQVTLSIKNLMGVIVGDKGAIMHFQIDDKLADLASVVRPRLNIIDGTVGSELDEVLGKPVPMDILIAGTDIVATDAVGCAVMGLSPETVRHLKLAEGRSLGVAELGAIEVLGDQIQAVAKRFRQGFSEERLRSYGFEHAVGEDVLRSLWERRGSGLTPPAQRSRV
jgi:uncharacterized protein (DUF362 family)